MNFGIDELFLGTSNIVLPWQNKSQFPAAFKLASRLHTYGSLQNSIEINSSFYRMPKPKTIEKWSEEVPQDFRFTFKFFKGISHQKGLNYDRNLLSEFMALMQHCPKKACLLLQFPPSINTAYNSKIRELLSEIRNFDPDETWKIAIEFRNSGLYCEETDYLLDDLRMGLVVHDKLPIGLRFSNENLPFYYLRFHGPQGDYRGSYDLDVLHEYAGYISAWKLQGKGVYVYFNNTMGQAWSNLQQLKEALQCRI